MIENKYCPYCGEYVTASGDYARSKQGIKQWFHYECMVKASFGGKYVDNRTDSRSGNGVGNRDGKR